MHGRDNRGVRPPTIGRRTRGDALHAGNPRGDDGHVGGGHHGITAPRDITSDRIHRNVAVTEHDAGKRLHFEVAQRFPLLLGEISHLRLGKLDVVEIAFAHLADRALDFFCAELEACGRPVIEFLRQRAHCRVAPGLDLRENAFHGLPHLGVGSLDGTGVHSALEIAGHGCFPPCHSTSRHA